MGRYGNEGRIDQGTIDFLLEIEEETGETPDALLEYPKIPFDLHLIVRARNELSLNEPITFSEINAYLDDVPVIHRHRFKRLVRTFDIAMLRSY